MLETILSMLPIPSWILLILLGIVILWKIFVFIYETNKNNKDFSGLSATIKALEILMSKIKNDIKFIANYLAEKSDKNFDRTQLESCSPLKLTPIGEKFLEDVGFIELFTNNQNDFFQIIDLEKPNTKYDVEIIARKSFMILFEKDYFSKIKIYLYNEPKKTIESISTPASVYIRDKYLEKHPEIKE